MPSASLRISALYMYPLKSAAGVRVPAVTLDPLGVAGDRRWMVVDDTSRFVSQREQPRMALLQATHVAAGLQVQFPGLPPLVAPTPGADAARRAVTVWQDTAEAVDGGAEAAGWLSRALGFLCALVYCPPEFDRRVDTTYASGTERVSFADGFPLLVIGQASLDELNARLERKGLPPAPMNRFRPNIVIDGAEPFAEDTWRRLAVGDGPDAIELAIVKPCARCAIVPVDQATGVRGTEPLATLATFRREGTKVLFGQNALHRACGTIREGAGVRPLGKFCQGF